MKKKILFIFVFIFFAVIFSSFFYFLRTERQKVLQELALVTSDSAEKYRDLADFYFTEAGDDYDLKEYDEMISHCELSRENSFRYTQEVREIKARITRDEKVFQIYSQIADKHIIIYTNLYEACEYLESAARQYKIGDRLNAGGNIEKANEKIRAHDFAVAEANTLVAEYEVELEQTYSKFKYSILFTSK